MPIIRIDYDNNKLKEKEVLDLSNAVQEIVSEITGIQDVFVYANSSQIKVKIAPIEVFVEMSAPKIKDLDKLTEDIKTQIIEWKKETSFNYPINLTIIPMSWKIEIGI